MDMTEEMMQKIIKILSGEATDEEVQEMKNKTHILIPLNIDIFYLMDWARANKN